MPLRLRKRKGSRNWWLRGTVRGIFVEESTGTDSRPVADAVRVQREAELLNRSVFGAKAAGTWIEAAVSYLETRRPGRSDRRYIEKLNEHWLATPLARIDQAELDRSAQQIYPKASNETRNRQFYTPAGAILHHAAEHGLTDWRKIRRPKLKNPRNRFLPDHAAALLLKHAGPDLKPLLTMLFYTGARIGEAVSLTWGDVDLRRRWLTLDVAKQDEQRGVYIHDALLIELANMTKGTDRDSVFGFTSRWSVYKPLRELCKAVGVKFTPHMARHSFATWLRQQGHDLRKVQEAGRWKDYKSVLRYSHVEAAEVRSAVASLPTVGGQNQGQQKSKSLKQKRKSA